MMIKDLKKSNVLLFYATAQRSINDRMTHQ